MLQHYAWIGHWITISFLPIYTLSSVVGVPDMPHILLLSKQITPNDIWEFLSWWLVNHNIWSDCPPLKKRSVNICIPNPNLKFSDLSNILYACQLSIWLIFIAKEKKRGLRSIDTKKYHRSNTFNSKILEKITKGTFFPLKIL